jgi:hypothetical protein
MLLWLEEKNRGLDSYTNLYSGSVTLPMPSLTSSMTISSRASPMVTGPSSSLAFFSPFLHCLYSDLGFFASSLSSSPSSSRTGCMISRITRLTSMSLSTKSCCFDLPTRSSTALQGKVLIWSAWPAVNSESMAIVASRRVSHDKASPSGRKLQLWCGNGNVDMSMPQFWSMMSRVNVAPWLSCNLCLGVASRLARRALILLGEMVKWTWKALSQCMSHI